MGVETELQGALASALSGYAPLTALGAKVHDAAPQKADGGNLAAFPYVELGAVVIAEFDTAHELGFDFIARIHTRSRSAGMKETKDIQGAIYARLHRGALTMAGHRLIDMQRQSSDVTRDSGGAFHGVCEYRGLIETNT